MPRARRARGAHYKRQMFADKLKMYSARVRRLRSGEWPRAVRVVKARAIFTALLKYLDTREQKERRRKKGKEKKRREKSTWPNCKYLKRTRDLQRRAMARGYQRPEDEHEERERERENLRVSTRFSLADYLDEVPFP